MDFEFQVLPYEPLRFMDEHHASIPKRAGVYKIFDTRGKLIVLDKTSNLFERFQRYYGERTELVRDLDLRLEPHTADGTGDTQSSGANHSSKLSPVTSS